MESVSYNMILLPIRLPPAGRAEREPEDPRCIGNGRLPVERSNFVEIHETRSHDEKSPWQGKASRNVYSTKKLAGRTRGPTPGGKAEGRGRAGAMLRRSIARWVVRTRGRAR